MMVGASWTMRPKHRLSIMLGAWAALQATPPDSKLGKEIRMWSAAMPRPNDETLRAVFGAAGNEDDDAS